MSPAARRSLLTTFNLLAPMLLFTSLALPQEPPARPIPAPAAPGPAPGSPQAAAAPAGNSDVLLKRIDDLLWYQKLGDIAEIDKDKYTGPPNEHAKNKKAPGAANPILLHCYTFIPKNLDRSRKQPLIVFVHQGVHASLDTTIDAHLVRELISRDTPSLPRTIAEAPATAMAFTRRSTTVAVRSTTSTSA